MKKYLTEQLFERLRQIETSTGFTLDKAIRSGRMNSDSAIGIYAGDAQAYRVFAPLFEPIIRDYHGIEPEKSHKNIMHPVDLPDLDPEQRYIRSTRVRVARNLYGYSFTNHIELDDRKRLEYEIVGALIHLEGDLAGKYFSFNQIDGHRYQFLKEKNLLFEKGDRFQDAAGINSDFPKGRGIFFTPDERLRVWLNEEDHLRIISQDVSSDLSGVFNHFVQAIHVLEEKLTFAQDEIHGYLTSCPTNVGTSMRAGVHIHLERLQHNRPLLAAITEAHNLQIRGTQGEKTSVENGIFDISNRQRYGISEVDIIKTLHRGLLAVIEAEKSL